MQFKAKSIASRHRLQSGQIRTMEVDQDIPHRGIHDPFPLPTTGAGSSYFFSGFMHMLRDT